MPVVLIAPLPVFFDREVTVATLPTSNSSYNTFMRNCPDGSFRTHVCASLWLPDVPQFTESVLYNRILGERVLCLLLATVVDPLGCLQPTQRTILYVSVTCTCGAGADALKASVCTYNNYYYRFVFWFQQNHLYEERPLVTKFNMVLSNSQFINPAILFTRRVDNTVDQRTSVRGGSYQFDSTVSLTYTIIYQLQFAQDHILLPYVIDSGQYLLPTPKYYINQYSSLRGSHYIMILL